MKYVSLFVRLFDARSLPKNEQANKQFSGIPASVFLFCCFALLLLWLPGLKYAPVSDTIVYGLLGREFWEHGRYWLLGAPFAKHLPMQAIVSYPFTELVGLQAGMRLSTLVAGMGTLMALFFLARRRFGATVAAIAAVAVLLHPAFILMAQQGSGDLLFALLFLLSVHTYLRAGEDRRWYLAAGVLAGAMCVTRYNGIPVAGFFVLWVLWKRWGDLRSPFLWAGAIAGGGIIASWFIRNTLVFGSPFHSDYTVELAAEAPDPVAQFLSNIIYYGNPIHNILPFLLAFSFYGLWRFGRREPVLVLAMLSAWALTAIWWVQAIRFAFAGYILLILFAAAGIVELAGRMGRWKGLFVVACATAFLGSHGPAICVYTYGECNAWVDRHIGLLPRNLGLTPEGFYAWHQAKEWLNMHAESGALLVTAEPLTAAAWKEGGVFRPDIQVSETPLRCPYYRIEQDLPAALEVLYQTEDAPVTKVGRMPCVR